MQQSKTRQQVFREVCNAHSHAWNMGMFRCGRSEAKSIAAQALIAWKAQWWTAIRLAFPEEFKHAGYSDINTTSSGVEYNSRRVAE